MTDLKKVDQAAEAHDPRAWVAPRVTRMTAGDAEDVGPSGDDGVIGSS